MDGERSEPGYLLAPSPFLVLGFLGLVLGSGLVLVLGSGFLDFLGLVPGSGSGYLTVGQMCHFEP